MRLNISFRLAILCCHCFVLMLAQQRQYGGYDVAISEYPFVVAIAFGTNLKGNGAILAPKWVLSSADTFLKQPYTEYEAYAGADNFETGEGYLNERIYPHQGWSGYIDNIALMKLKRELRFGPTIKPIKMIDSNPDEKEVLMLSYGENEQGTTHLRASQYLLVSNADCVANLQDERAKGVVQQKEGYCLHPAIDNGLNGQCYDDTGAPLISNDRLVAVWSLRVDEVVTSYNNLSLATRITTYRGWIESTMKL